MKYKRWWIVLILLLLILLGLGFLFRDTIRLRLTGRSTVADAIKQYGPAAEARLIPYFNKAGVPFPPEKIALVALKEEKVLELYARQGDVWRFIHEWPILASSGKMGPKLRRGDRQVPEGIYRIVSLNPNSQYHLSMELNYPNDFDRQMAELEGREDPGSLIFIHGSHVSIGCLAMGDPAIEELFVLVYRAGRSNVSVIIAPRDLRSDPPHIKDVEQPEWVHDLYKTLAKEIEPFSKPPAAEGTQ